MMDVGGIKAETYITGDGWLCVKVKAGSKTALQKVPINCCPMCGRDLKGESQ